MGKRVTITWLLAGWVTGVLWCFTWRSYESFDTPKEALIKIGLAALGGLVLLGWVRERAIGIVWHPLLLAGLAFWGWGWLSLVASSQRLFTIHAQWFALHLLLLMVLIPTLLSRRDGVERLWSAIAVIGGIVAVIAIAQWFGVNFERGVRIVRLKESIAKTEIYSTIGNPNYLAAVLAFLLPVMISLAVARQQPTGSTRNRLFPGRWPLAPGPSFLFWGCAGVSLVALLLSRSKGGLAAAIIGLVVLWVLWGVHDHWSRRRWLLTGAGGLGLAFLLYLLVVWQAPSLGMEWGKLIHLSWDDPSVKGRLLIWRTALEMIKAHPVIGVGTGAFGPQYQAYRALVFDRLVDPAATYPASEHSYDEAGHAHNDWLQLAAENGLVGLALFTLFMWAVYTAGVRLLRNRAASQEVPLPFTLYPLPPHLLCGLLAGMSALLVHALVDFPLHQPASTLLFWLGLATVLVMGGRWVEWPLPAWFSVKAVRWGVGGATILGAGLLMVQAARPVMAGVSQREAWWFMNDQQWAAAIPVIETGLQWEPDHPALTLYLGVARFQQGDLAGSREAYERYQLLYSDFQTLYNLGLIAVRQRQFDQADRYFRKALRYKPTLAEAAAALALVAEQTGRPDEARRYRRQAVQLRNAGG